MFVWLSCVSRSTIGVDVEQPRFPPIEEAAATPI